VDDKATVQILYEAKTADTAINEKAHLIHPNHSAAFWNEVDKVMPNCQERKASLRDHGAGMDLSAAIPAPASWNSD